MPIFEIAENALREIEQTTFDSLGYGSAPICSKCFGTRSRRLIPISQFLGWEDELGNDVRIVLVAAGFSPEITTTVLWLNERDLDIRCIRWRPYLRRGTILLDIHQIIPLPEAACRVERLAERLEVLVAPCR